MRHLYNTQVEVLRLSLSQDRPGLPTQSWQKIPAIVDPILGVPGEMKCRIDLAYQRPGKDQPMPLVSGRAPDRVGLMFFDATDEIRSGDRFHCVDGPISGTFEIRVMPDPAADYSAAHHMEVQIIEVAQTMQPNLLNRTEAGTG
jgi:hypothetical protein